MARRKSTHNGIYVRCDWERYDPPAEAKRIAEERTADIIQGACMGGGGDRNPLKIIAESCYLQGVADAAQALHMCGEASDEV